MRCWGARGLLRLLPGLSAVAAVAAQGPQAASWPACTWSDCAVCLPGLPPPGRNLSLTARDGLTYKVPLRIARPNAYWDSLGVVGQVFGILAKERLGLAVEYVSCIDETQCLLAAMGCLGWSELASCVPASTAPEARAAYQGGRKHFPDPLPDVFAILEEWVTAVDRTAGNPAPEVVSDLGSIGYSADYNLWVLPRVVEDAWRARNMSLRSFEAYTLPDAASFFTPPAALLLDPAFQPTHGRFCPGDARATYSATDLAFAMEHLHAFGYTCQSGFWLSPACAALGDQWSTGCTSLIDALWVPTQSPLYYGISLTGMRIANTRIGAAAQVALIMESRRSVMFTWWTSDTLYRNLHPQKVILNHWDNTTSRNFPTKTVWEPILAVSRQLQIFFRQFTLNGGMVNWMLDDVAEQKGRGYGPSEDAQPGFYQKIACDWLHRNPSSWEALLPNPRSCASGEVFDEQTSACMPCPPGTYWASGGGASRVCRACRPGDTQPDAGQLACVPCGRGSHNDAVGLRVAPDSCPPCEVGRYGDTRGRASCSPCPSGQSTNSRGSQSLEDCVCAAGFHSTRPFPSLRGQGAVCAPCQGAMNCAVGQLLPNLKRGFFSRPEEPLRVYKCSANVAAQTSGSGSAEASACAGGPVGNVTCKDERHGFLCNSCAAGKIPAGTRCIACVGTDYAGIVLCVAAVLAFVVAALVAATRSLVKGNPRTVAAASMFTQLTTFAQVLAAIQSTGVSWGEPFNELQRSLLILGLDVDVVHLGCASMREPSARYFVRMLGPLGAILLLVLLALLVNAFMVRVVLGTDAIINAIGQVLVITFISIALSALMPFQCFRHPDDELSLTSAPTIMCWAGGEHTTMVAASILGLGVYVVGTLSMVFFAIWRYPTEIVKDGMHFIRRFQFLFYRFGPEHYWFVGLLMGRNLLLALFPMLIPPESRDTTVALMQLAIMLALAISTRIFPWRSGELNQIDVGLNLALQVVLIGATLTSTGRGISKLASTLLCALCGGSLIFCTLAIVCKILQSRAKPHIFSLFISHHKSGGACTARFLKTVMQHRLKGPVFFDSDNLSSFGGIFDAVKASKSVLVLLSGETLCRPWCVGEVVTAQQCRIPMIPCTIGNGAQAPAGLVDQYFELSEEGLASLHGQFEVLLPYGITLQDVQPAFDTLMSARTIHFDLSDAESLEVAVTGVCRAVEATAKDVQFAAARGISNLAGRMRSSTMRWAMHANAAGAPAASSSGSWLILSDPLDVEAAASARIIKVMMQRKAQQHVAVDTGLSSEQLAGLLRVPGLRVILWLVTPTTLQSAPQLARLALAYRVLPKAFVSPVLIGERFNFPGEAFYARLEADGGDFGAGAATLFSELAGVPLRVVEVAAAVRQVFNGIANLMNVPYANEAMLLTSLMTLIGCVSRPRKRGAVNETETEGPPPGEKGGQLSSAPERLRSKDSQARVEAEWCTTGSN